MKDHEREMNKLKQVWLEQRVNKCKKKKNWEVVRNKQKWRRGKRECKWSEKYREWMELWEKMGRGC